MIVKWRRSHLQRLRLVVRVARKEAVEAVAGAFAKEARHREKGVRKRRPVVVVAVAVDERRVHVRLIAAAAAALAAAAGGLVVLASLVLGVR